MRAVPIRRAARGAVHRRALAAAAALARSPHEQSSDEVLTPGPYAYTLFRVLMNFVGRVPERPLRVTESPVFQKAAGRRGLARAALLFSPETKGRSLHSG
jgi:hypothetical protein